MDIDKIDWNDWDDDIEDKYNVKFFGLSYITRYPIIIISNNDKFDDIFHKITNVKDKFGNLILVDNVPYVSCRGEKQSEKYFIIKCDLVAFYEYFNFLELKR